MSYLFQSEVIEPYAYAEVFTKEQCEEIIKIGLNSDLIHSTVGKDGESDSVDTEWRKSKNTWLPPSAGSEFIYGNLASAAIFLNGKHFQFDLSGFAEHLQFAQYDAPGGRYNPHTDCIHHGVIRKLSVSVQLSDEAEYEGGDICINYGTELLLPRKQGTMIAFPSSSLHSVQPVTKGTRYSLVGWITGPRFK